MRDNGFSVYKQERTASTGLSSLIATLNSFHPIGEGIRNFLEKHSYTCSFEKGKFLLKTGDVCEDIYYIKNGVVRGFIKEGDKDITTWITADNELVSSISAIDNREATRENVQAIEDCDMLAMRYSDLEKLYTQFPEFNIVTRKLLQRYYQDAEDRAFIVRLTNAEDKYEQFLIRYSHLANRVPLKYIASFLGITLETLSRVRKRLSSKR
jgi:CRP-like cAMP-binding protein